MSVKIHYFVKYNGQRLVVVVSGHACYKVCVEQCYGLIQKEGSDD